MRRGTRPTRRGLAAPLTLGITLVAGLSALVPAARHAALSRGAGTSTGSGRSVSTAHEAPVADAAMRGDTSQVRALLKQGADVNAAQGDGMTALHWTATRGDAAVARMLVFAGARLDATTRNGSYTPLHLACRSGKSAVAEVLLDAGADVDATTASGGATALHMAAGIGDTAVLRVLLVHKATVDVRESAFGQTPLMWAAAADRVPAMRLLLSAGADLRLASKVEDVSAEEKAASAALGVRTKKMVALRAAEQPTRPASGTQAAPAPGAARAATPASNAMAVTASASANSDEASKDEHDGKSGAAKGDAKVHTKADEKGGAHAVDASTDSAAGTKRSAGGPALIARTPADSARAATENRSLSYGDLVGKSGGLTPLLFAVRQGNLESVEALLAAGADVNQVSEGDHTSPLLMATINGQFDLAKLLLEKGAKATLSSDAGATPLYATINVQWAAKSLYPQPTAQYQQQTTHLELMEALLKAGADVNARLNKHLWFMSFNFDLLGVNTEGATAFWRAAYGLDVPAMKLLLKYNADPNIPTKKPAGRLRGDDAPAPGEAVAGAPKDFSGVPPVPIGGPAVYPIHAASGVGYGEGYAANSHRHAPDAWIPTVKFLVEELGADVNLRDHNGFTPLHHAAARGDDALIEYFMSKGADITVVARRGQTVADMANGPVQRIPPFVETVALLEKLGSKNSHKCKSC
ncbi:MAG: ankyrin repeat domain-containing protein [Gemmatimonadota bacterium]